jgi:hypothetical protein
MSSIKDSITGFLGSLISFIWQKTPNWAKKMIKYLRNAYDLQAKQFKMDLAATGFEKGHGLSLKGVMLAFIGLLGGSIGAFLGRYFGFISKLPIFNKIGQMFRSLKSIPFLGKLIKAVKFGFKWIGYPLQLLIGLFDFIKAFKESEADTLWGKIKDGLWAALEGFIRLPIEFLGWIAEEVLELFGIKFDGQEFANKAIKFFKDLFNFVIFGWEELFKLVKLEFPPIAQKIKEWTDLILDSFNPLINLIVDMWNGLIEDVKNLLEMTGFNFDWMDKAKLNHRGTSETGQRIIKTEQEIAAAKAAETERTTAAIKELGKDANTSQGWVNDQLRAFRAWVTNNNVQQNNGGGGDTRQIPDEQDNAFVAAGGMSTGMDE